MERMERMERMGKIINSEFIISIIYALIKTNFDCKSQLILADVGNINYINVIHLSQDINLFVNKLAQIIEKIIDNVERFFWKAEYIKKNPCDMLTPYPKIAQKNLEDSINFDLKLELINSWIANLESFKKTVQSRAKYITSWKINNAEQSHQIQFYNIFYNTYMEVISTIVKDFRKFLFTIKSELIIREKLESLFFRKIKRNTDDFYNKQFGILMKFLKNSNKNSTKFHLIVSNLVKKFEYIVLDKIQKNDSILHKF